MNAQHNNILNCSIVLIAGGYTLMVCYLKILNLLAMLDQSLQ